MPQPFSGIEPGPAMQQAPVVHDQQLAGVELETDLELRRAQQMIERAACLVVTGQRLRGTQWDEIQPRTEIHRLQASGCIELDRRCAGHEIGRIVSPSESDRSIRQELERLIVTDSQGL